MSDAEDRKEAKKTLAKLKDIPRDKLTIDQQADLKEAQGILRTPPPKPKKPIVSRKVGGGDLSPKQQEIAKLGGNRNKIDSEDFAILRKKKYGGKITFRMTGGQVVDSSYD